MAQANFEICLEHVFRFEGGYVDHPLDPGGATKYGITRATLSRWRGRPVAKAEVMALTRADAAAIYRANYWDAVAGDELPAGLDLALFDYAVNSGPGRAIRTLQALHGVRADGIIGPVTRAAIAGAPVPVQIRTLCRARRGFLGRLPTWATFGRGWSNRVAMVEKAALALAATARASRHSAPVQ